MPTLDQQDKLLALLRNKPRQGNVFPLRLFGMKQRTACSQSVGDEYAKHRSWTRILKLSSPLFLPLHSSPGLREVGHY